MQRRVASLLLLAACALLPGAMSQAFPVLVAQPRESDFGRGFDAASRILGGNSLRGSRVVSTTYATGVLSLSALNVSTTAGYVAVVGADLSAGYPADWNARGIAVVGPVDAHKNDLLRDWPNTPIAIDAALDTKLLLGIHALTIGSLRTVTSIVVIVDESVGMACHHVAGIAATYGNLVSVPVTERALEDFGSTDAIRAAIFVNVTSPATTGFVMCTRQASRAAAITLAVNNAVPLSTADGRIDVFAALQSPSQLTHALAMVNASAVTLARVGSASWLPDTLQNLGGMAFVRQCRSSFEAAGFAAAEFNEGVLHGCAAMAVVARGVNTTFVPPAAADLPRAFRQAVASAGTFYLPDADTTGALVLGPYDSGCGAGAPVASLSTSTVGAGVVDSYRVPEGSSQAACSVDMSVLQSTVYAVQVVAGGARAVELADALHDGMVAAGLDTSVNGLHRVAVFRMFVADGTLPANSSEFAAVQLHLQKPLVIGMIGSVGVAAEAIDRLGVLSLGNEYSDFHLGADAVGVIGYPNDVGFFGSFAGDLALAARYAVDLHGSQDAARFFRVSMQPLISRTYRAAIMADVNARLAALGTAALADGSFVAEPAPTAPEDRTDPSVVLVVGDPDAEPHFSAMLRLVEATPLLIALVPRVVHERTWCQNLLAQWRPTVATDVAGRVVFLDNDEAVHATAAWRWPDSIPRNRTRQARGYLLAQAAAYVAAKTVLQNDRLAVARTAVYHSAVWQAGNLTVSGLGNVACSGLDLEGTMLGDIFTVPESVTAHGSDDGDEHHEDEHDDDEVHHDDHHDDHHDEQMKTSPCACNQRTVTRRVSSLDGTVANRFTYNPCNNDRPIRVADDTIVALGLYVAAILVVTVLVLIRSFVAWRFLRSRNMADDGSKELKAATESAEEKMPSMYRIPAPVYMIPVFAVPLILVLAFTQLPVRAATARALDDSEASESALAVMARVLGCTQSSVDLALEVGRGVPSAVRFGFQEKVCEGFDTFVETSLEDFYTALRASEALPTQRQQQRTRAVAAAASLALLGGVRTASSRAAIAIQRSTSEGARAHVPRIANALVAAEQLLPVVAAILPPSVATGSSPPAPGVAESYTLSDFRAAVQSIRLLLPAESVRLPAVRAAFASNEMREYAGLLHCIQVAHNRTFNFIDTGVRDSCMVSRGLEIADVAAMTSTITALAANGTARLAETVLEIDRLRSEKHSDAIASANDAWQARFYTMIGVTFILCAAACVMQSSHTHNFLRAFREIAVLEASVSRWIPIAVLDVMKIDSVHDIDDEPELRDLAIVLVDYSRAFAMATKHEDADGALDILGRVIEAVTSSLADDGEIEHLTTTSCCVLCEHSDSALLAAIELEHAVRSVLYSRIEETREALDNGDDDNVTVGVGVHRDTISIGFMGAGKHTFGGAFGHGIRIARLLAELCPVYGAAVIVSSSALDTVDRRTIDLRDLGSIVTRQYGPLPISEAMTMMDRTDLDAFKRETLLDFNRISAAQAAASTPATDDQVLAVAQAVQRCQHFASLSGVTDPALGIKLAWSGKSPADNVAAYVDV